MIYIVIIYLVFTIVIGFLAKRKANTSRAFSGAGLGIFMCVAAGAGEWMGGTATTGVAEYGYLYGISGAWYTIANGLGIMVLAIFFAKLYRNMNVHTVPEIVGGYIGKKAQATSSIVLIIVMIFVGVSQMIAVGSLGSQLFGLSINTSIIILGLVVILYTLLGGMFAVGYTNVMHLIIMYTGMVIAIIFLMNYKPNVGEPIKFSNALPDSYYSLSTIGWDKISSWIIASILGACTAQAGIQPVLAAKDAKTAVRSSIIIALIVAPFGILTAILGMFAKIYFPELASAKLALPSLIQLLPDWISGFVMAALLAAILSTASPIFLACGTLFTRDIFITGRPETHDKKELLVSKIATVIAGLICMVLALLMFNFSAVLDIVYFAYSLRGSLFIIILFAILSKKAKLSEVGTIVSIVLTAAVGLFWATYKAIVGYYPISNYISGTYAAVFTALVSMIVVEIISIKKCSPKNNINL